MIEMRLSISTRAQPSFYILFTFGEQKNTLLPSVQYIRIVLDRVRTPDRFKTLLSVLFTIKMT